MLQDVILPLQEVANIKLNRLKYFKENASSVLDSDDIHKKELLIELVGFYKDTKIDVSSYIFKVNKEYQQRRSATSSIIKSIVELKSRDIEKELADYDELLMYVDMYAEDHTNNGVIVDE